MCSTSSAPSCLGCLELSDHRGHLSSNTSLLRPHVHKAPGLAWGTAMSSECLPPRGQPTSGEMAVHTANQEVSCQVLGKRVSQVRGSNGEGRIGRLQGEEAFLRK